MSLHSDELRQLLAQLTMRNGQTDDSAQKKRPPFSEPDFSLQDTSETVMVRVSALALIKMLQHARAGVPLEVMGLLVGKFVDEYTINVTDVFAMPQKGTGVNVEAVDPVHQLKMMEMLKVTGRAEDCVGWYHSHPGFGCWLSSLDVQTQRSFEALHPRAVALVVDPLQSVKGKVMMDVFRSIDKMAPMPSFGGSAPESRITTSNLGYLQQRSTSTILQGLGKQYYGLNVVTRCNQSEQNILLSYRRVDWTQSLRLEPFKQHADESKRDIAKLGSLAKDYAKAVTTTTTITSDKSTEEPAVVVGKQCPKRHLEELALDLMRSKILQGHRTVIAYNLDASKPKDTAGGTTRASG